MADEHEQQTKVNNLSEQLKSLKTELNQTVSDFEERQALRAQLDSDIQELQKLLPTLKAERSETIRDTELRRAEIGKSEDALAQRQRDASVSFTKRDEALKLREETLRGREAAIDTKTKEHNDKIAGMQLRLAELAKQEGNLLATIEENKSILETQTRQKSINASSIDSQQILFEEEVQRFQARVDATRKELAEIMTKVKAANDAAVDPQRQLKAQEEEIRRKKADLDVYETRIRARWRFLFPDKAINI